MSTQSQIWKHHSKVASLNTFFDLSIEVSESISIQSKICLCFLLIQQFNVCIEFIKTITINKKIILKAIFFQGEGWLINFDKYSTMFWMICLKQPEWLLMVINYVLYKQSHCNYLTYAGVMVVFCLEPLAILQGLYLNNSHRFTDCESWILLLNSRSDQNINIFFWAQNIVQQIQES